MSIEIRLIRTHDEYRAVEALQREVWGAEEREIVPDELLLTAQQHGGLVLGAFERAPGDERPRLIGFVFGIIGLAEGGRVLHHSHMAAVLPGIQNQNIGYRLKLAQREHVLAQGLDLITWTYDPLESRNAYLNIHKLGATCNTFLSNLYGALNDALNAGLPSDRFLVDWRIAGAHVAARLGGQAGASLPALREAGVPLLNPPPPTGHPSDFLRPPETMAPIAGERLLVQIPANYQAIKAADMGLARAWRQHARTLFEALFAAGYTVTDLLATDGQCYYLLETTTDGR